MFGNSDICLNFCNRDYKLLINHIFTLTFQSQSLQKKQFKYYSFIKTYVIGTTNIFILQLKTPKQRIKVSNKDRTETQAVLFQNTDCIK